MIKLVKSSFFNETETKKALADFIVGSTKHSMGPECRQFEESFAKKQERKFAVFVSSGSTANLVLLQAMLNVGRLKTGDKVGFSALTWATNVMPIIQLGLVPVAIDCSKETLNISPEILENHIQSLDALFITNVLGFCDNLEEIERMCKKYGAVLLEDNCESLGSRASGKLLGNFGVASTFSFFVGHHMSTIEGGMICTDDEELYSMLVQVRAHGWDRDVSESRQVALREKFGVTDFYAKYTFYDLAYNARPTEIAGFLGNNQIGFWDTIVSKRQEHVRKFLEAASSNSKLLPCAVSHMDIVSNFAMPVVCADKETFDFMREKFTENGVEIRPIIAGDMTKQPFYKKYVPTAGTCENASLIHQYGFYFPNNPELTEEEVVFLCNLLA